MKFNKKQLPLRIITFPIKLAFMLSWHILFSIIISILWVKNGSQELLYGNDQGKSLTKLIEQNEAMLKFLKKIEKPLNFDN